MGVIAGGVGGKAGGVKLKGAASWLCASRLAKAFLFDTLS